MGSRSRQKNRRKEPVPSIVIAVGPPAWQRRCLLCLPQKKQCSDCQRKQETEK
jgi:hypothetical protein